MNETAVAPKSNMKKIMDKTELLKNVLPQAEHPYTINMNGREIQMYVARVTSQMAADILEHSKIKNRNTTKKNLALIKSEMESGKWKFDGAPIRFDEDGNMLDGKHRMTALANTHRLAFDFTFIVGLERSSFKVMDSGKKRSAGDVFSINSVPHPQIAATAVKFISALEDGFFRTNEAINGGLTNSEAYEKYLQLVDFDQYLQKAVDLNKSGEKKRILSDSILAGFFYMFSRVNLKDAEQFIESLVLGTNIPKNSPIRVARQRLVSSKHDVGARLKIIERNRIVAWAWKKHRRGEEVTKLLIPKTNEGLQILVKKNKK